MFGQNVDEERIQCPGFGASHLGGLVFLLENFLARQTHFELLSNDVLKLVLVYLVQDPRVLDFLCVGLHLLLFSLDE